VAVVAHRPDALRHDFDSRGHAPGPRPLVVAAAALRVPAASSGVAGAAPPAASGSQGQPRPPPTPGCPGLPRPHPPAPGSLEPLGPYPRLEKEGGAGAAGGLEEGAMDGMAGAQAEAAGQRTGCKRLAWGRDRGTGEGSRRGGARAGRLPAHASLLGVRATVSGLASP